MLTQEQTGLSRGWEQYASTAGLFHTWALLWVTDSGQAPISLSDLTEVHWKGSALKSSMEHAGWVAKQAHIFHGWWAERCLESVLGR